MRWTTLILCSTLPGCIFSSRERVAADVNAQVASQYNFRGQVMTNRAVAQGESVVHLPVRGGGEALFRVWGNLDLDSDTGSAWFSPGHAGEFTEVDLSALYAREVAGLDVAAGIVSYTWPNGEEFPFRPFPPTVELLARASLEVQEWRPAVSFHYDFDEVGGIYVRGSLARDFELTDAVGLELQAWLGWSEEDHSSWLFKTEKSAWNDLGAMATVYADLDEVTRVRAGVAGSTILDDDLRSWFLRNGVDSDNVWVFAGIGWAF